MKLHLMFLLMDILLFLACGYFWPKYVFAHALRWQSKLQNQE